MDVKWREKAIGTPAMTVSVGLFASVWVRVALAQCVRAASVISLEVALVVVVEKSMDVVVEVVLAAAVSMTEEMAAFIAVVVVSDDDSVRHLS